MMETCGNCGYKNPKNSDYCRNCGQKLPIIEENINNLIIQHKIDNEYRMGVKIENINWKMKYNNIYIEYKITLIGEIKTNIEINTEIIGNNGEIIKKYRDTIFKTDTQETYNYEKPIINIEEFNTIKKIVIYPQESNKRLGN